MSVELHFSEGSLPPPYHNEWTLTVNGAVARPLTLTVPLGMSLREVLDLAGGATVAEPGFINGGPMMGSLMTSLETPVTKTTGGLLVPDAQYQGFVLRGRAVLAAQA